MSNWKAWDIDIETYEGLIPSGCDLIVYEKGQDPLDGLVMHGFDEVGMFDNSFYTPQYAMLKR